MLWCILFCGWYDRIKMKYWRSFIEIKAAGDWQKRKSIISACARLSLHTLEIWSLTSPPPPQLTTVPTLNHWRYCLYTLVYQGNAAIFLFKGWKYAFLFYFVGLWPPDFAALLFPCPRKIAGATHRQLTRFPTLELHWTSEWDQPGPYQMPGLWSRSGIRNQDDGFVISDIDAVKIWTVSNVISQSENYFPIVFIHLCHSSTLHWH